MLDDKLRRALDLAALESTPEFTYGARIQSRLQGPVSAGGTVVLHAVTHASGSTVQHRLSVTLTRAILTRGLGRDIPRLGRLDLWVLAATSKHLGFGWGPAHAGVHGGGWRCLSVGM